MFDDLARRVNGDMALVRRGRYVNLSFLLDIGAEAYLIRISEGAIAEVKPATSLMSDWTFALRASPEGWEKFTAAKPPAGFTDIFALQRKKLLRIEGNLQPFMANLLYFKDVLASLRQREAA